MSRRTNAQIALSVENAIKDVLPVLNKAAKEHNVKKQHILTVMSGSIKDTSRKTKSSK